ncbi:MAG TPA: DNA polymerase III subunit gamma/tau, partial [Sphingomicrobium sp.]|nr:DNA polymerase III subunit gamma/tau [Sphingomicrobium sp.]
RIPAEKLAEHFAHVAEAEGVEIEQEALHAIARAAEGSARDGLSILDQAIAHGEGRVTAAQVRDMLGQADRGRIRRLLETLLNGDTADTLGQLDEAHSLGIEPGSLLRGLMESLHAVTRSKAGASADLMQSAEEREHSAELAAKLSWGNLHRLWQLLLKGLEDVRIAPDPHEAATMALLRLIHAADMPDPSLLASMLAGGVTPGAEPVTHAAAPGTEPKSSLPIDFPSLVEAVERQGKQLLGIQLRDHVGLVSFTPGEIVLKPLKPLGAEFARELAAAAKQATGQAWEVRLTDEGGSPSLQQQEAMAEERMRSAVLEEPNVKALLEEFPDATLETIDRKEA